MRMEEGGSRAREGRWGAAAAAADSAAAADDDDDDDVCIEMRRALSRLC